MSSSKITAYSYVRFSSPEQSQGDSLRRQVAAAATYCQRRGWRMDDTLSLRDLGVSAFRGDNAFNGNLGVFLEAVRRGSVPSGSALVVESIDRISRQGIDEGYDLCKRIIKSGILLVTLSPEREFGPEALKSLSKGALEILLILERAAEESERKSDRSRANWIGKRQAVLEQGAILTRRLPAWIQEHNGELELIRDKAAIVRRIFDLAIAGYGSMRIVARLTADNVQPLAEGKHWSRSYVALILNDRRAAGVYQPKDRKGNKAGDPIPGYYPAAITQDEYDLARKAARQHKRGRVGHHVNLFSGLLRNARHGDSYLPATRTWYGRQSRILVSLGSKEGRTSAPTFPLPAFEGAVLSLLAEINPEAILNGDAPPDESVALAAEKARVESRIADLERELLVGDVAAVSRALRVLEAQNRDLGEQLAAARLATKHPLSETWGEAKGLLDALEAAPEPMEARTRLRAALIALIAEAWLLVVPLPNHDRLCAVQLFFHTDDPKKQRRRDYLIWYRPGRNNGQVAQWQCRSLAEVIQPGQLDLRKGDHVVRLERVLLKLDLDAAKE